MRQTTFPKGNTSCERRWFLVDAKDAVLGRIASRIAFKLLGKDDPNYCTYTNSGPAIVVINAKFVKVTGNKLQEPFYWYTGFPGGIKSATIEARLQSKRPEDVLMKAVERMLGSTKLARAKLKNLRIFADENHTHAGQNPSLWNLADEHKMNKRREQNW